MGCGSGKTAAAAQTPVLLGSTRPKFGSKCLPQSESGVWSIQTSTGSYVTAEAEGAAAAHRQEVTAGAMITLESKGERKIALKSYQGKYLRVEPSGAVIWDRAEASKEEIFELFQDGEGKLVLRSDHGTYLCRDEDGSRLAARAKAWESFTVNPVLTLPAAVVLAQLSSACSDATTEAIAAFLAALPDISLQKVVTALDEDEKVGEPQPPPSLAELSAVCATATPENIADALAALPDSSFQRLVAAFDASEPKPAQPPEPDHDEVVIMEQEDVTDKGCTAFRWNCVA